MSLHHIHLHQMKIYLSVLLFLFSLSISLSQKSSINGLVIDKDTEETIPMANVSLKKQTETIISGVSNKTLVQGSVSDINGNFIIQNIEPGKYILECSFIGYKTYKKDIELKAQLFSDDGTKVFNITKTGKENEPEVLGKLAGEEILKQSGKNFIKKR